MKKMLLFLMLAASVAAPAIDKALDIRPAETDGKEPTAVEWENANAAALAAATDEDVLAAFVEDDAAAAELLAQVKGAYLTDLLVARQIAAVSQWTMGEEPCWLCFWKPSPAAGRKVWVRALVTRAETANDTYVKLFCLDQLRWCGCKCPCVVKRIKAIGTQSSDKAVKDMVDIVVRTLK